MKDTYILLFPEVLRKDSLPMIVGLRILFIIIQNYFNFYINPFLIHLHFSNSLNQFNFPYSHLHIIYPFEISLENNIISRF